MGSHARWRVTWLGALCALCLVLGVFRGTASATLQLDQSTDTALTIDGDTHWFNQNTMVSYGAYQYIAYWDAPDARTGVIYLKITRRKLSDNSLSDIRLDGTGGAITASLSVPNDGHNTVVMGLSPIDGRLHLSWSAHSAPHQYVQSSSRCMTQTTFSSSTCTFTLSSSQIPRSTTETSLTYPRYFNDAAGHLFFAYRYGINDNSDEYLNKYNDDGTWTQVGQVLHGYNAGQSWDSDGAGPSRTATHRGIYLMAMRFDRNGRLHMMWNWREDAPDSYDWGVHQHDVYYAYSDDSGVTWKDNSGTLVGDMSRSDPINVLDTSTMVVSVPGGYWIGNGDVEIDSNNQPHVVVPISDVQTTVTNQAHLRQTHFWRTTDGTWRQGFIESSGDGRQMEYGGGLIFDQADNAHYVYGRYNRDWAPWNSDGFRQAELPYDRVTIQNDGTQAYLNIVPFSTTTAIDTESYINLPISTSSGARNYRNITVRLKNNTAATSFVVYWTTDADPGYTVGKAQTFTITANDTSFKTYTFTVTDADWRGTLRDMELDPVGLTDVSGSGRDVSIDYVHIEDDQRSPNVGKAWEFNSGMQVMAAEASADDNWGTWNVEELLPDVTESNPVNDSVNDGGYNLDQDLYWATNPRKVDFMLTEQGAPGTESSVLHEFTITNDNVIKNWSFPVDAQGWTNGGDISSFGYASDGGVGSIGGTLTGTDSAVVSAGNIGATIGSDKTIVVRMKNSSAATTAKIYFITNSSTTWNETKSKAFTITARSGYTDYRVDMTGVGGWTTTSILKQLRIDPANDTTSSGSFNIDRVYVAP